MVADMGVKRSIARVLGTALAVAWLGGLATGIALGATLWVLNELDAANGLVLSLYLTALYGIVYSVGLVGAAILLVAVGRRPGPRLFVGFLLGFCVFLNGVLRFSPAIQLFSVVPSMNLIGAADLLAVIAASVAIAYAVVAATSSRRNQAIAVAVILLACLQAFHLWHEQTRRADLAQVVPPLLSRASPAPLPSVPDRFEDTRLLVIAFDGLTWEVLIPLLERGELPNFARLLQDAAYGYSETLAYAVSPVVWETISTGRRPEHHGIGHHFHFEFDGMSEPVRRLPVFQLCNSPMGLRRLLAATHRYAPWRTRAASSSDARFARFWEIVARSGTDVGVYDWLNTSPVPPIKGFMHGHGPFQPGDFPEDLEDHYPPVSATVEAPQTGRVRDPKVVTPLVRLDWDRFLALAKRFHPELLMYYTHFGDGINHLNWKVETEGPGLFYSGLTHPNVDPGNATSVANQYLDDILGDALARLPEDATIAIVSDHGFEFRGYEHDNAPPGVFILRGPGIEPGVISGASIYDVTPTLLHVLGLAVAEDMDGEPLEAALLGRPVETVASYGAAAKVAETDVDPEKLEDLEGYLRGLGYIVD